MRILGLATLAGACLATSPLLAADLFGTAPPPPDAPVMQQELGSNWYIRGDIGYGQVTQATVVPDAGLIQPDRLLGYFNGGVWQQVFAPDGSPAVFNDAPIGDPKTPVPVTRGNSQTTNAPIFNFGVGYRINDWVRIEGTYSFFHGPGLGFTANKICPQLANITPTTGTAVGYAWDPNPCTANLNVTQYNNLGLASAYVDLGHWWWGLTPYVGAGIGLNVNQITGTVTYTKSNDGATYTGNTTNGAAPAVWLLGTNNLPVQDPSGRYPGVGFGPANWDRKISQTKYTIAGQLAAGVGFPISQSAMLDIGYKATTTDISGGVKGLMQSLNMGVRYNLN